MSARQLRELFDRSVERHLAGDLAEAEAGYRVILRKSRKNVATLVNLGVLLKEREAYTEAARALQKAVKLAPDYAEGHNNLATVLDQLGRPEAAHAHYRKALSLKPDYAEAHYNLGLLLTDQGAVEEALDHFRRAVDIRPDYAEACVKMANALREWGLTDEALKQYEQASAGRPDAAGIRIRHALALPVIPASRDEMERHRRRLIDEVEALSSGPLSIDDPLQEVGQTNFYMAYHGLDDRAVQEAIARMYEKACPALLYTAPHCRPGGGYRPADPIKVGVCSRYLRGHAVTWCIRNLIRFLQKEGFEITLFTVKTELDAIWHELADEVQDVVVFPREDLAVAREKIAARALDVLIYPDIGMEPLTYFLAFARLAPVQCVIPGHPVTTGIGAMDYYLSWGPGSEPEDADAHYTEELVRLDGFLCYPRFELPLPRKTRSDYGLPKDRTVYVCTQTLFKFHPDFDNVLADILRADQNGQLILFESGRPEWREVLMARFGRTMPDLLGRVHMLERLPISDFIDLLSLCDVALDTIPFTGGNTSYQTFQVGTPLVTLPGQFKRGRSTAAMHWAMGTSDCVANSVKDYVAISLRLGRDAAYRDAVRKRILANNSVLFDNAVGLEGLKQFLQDKVRRETRAAAVGG